MWDETEPWHRQRHHSLILIGTPWHYYSDSEEQVASQITHRSGASGPLLAHLGTGLNVGKAFLAAMLDFLGSQVSHYSTS